MRILVDMPEEVQKPLEDAYYNAETYKAIIPEFLKLPKDKIDHALITTVLEEYKKTLIEYETQKINFEFNFVKKNYPEALSWWAIFGQKKVEITLPDN